MVVACGAYVGVQGLRPAPQLQVAPTLPTSFRLAGTAPTVPWPSTGEATLSVEGVGSFGSSGGQAEVPIASLAKMMTAYLVLREHPLSPSAPGPSVTVTQADVALYSSEIAVGDSAVPVAVGETLSERQMLEALLIGSADNFAVLMANWDAGSEAAFVAKMNAAAATLGMARTRYADASGLDPATVSTASDQLVMARVDMANPVIASIVAMTQATLPVAGLVRNYDALVGTNGVVGLKTGTTDQAGGCLAFAARERVAGRDELVLGVVLGQRGPSILQAAFDSSLRLITTARSSLAAVTVLPAGRRVAEVVAPWAAPTPASTASPIALVGWPGLRVGLRLRPARLSGSAGRGAAVGTVVASLGSQRSRSPVRSTESVPAAPLSWRLRQL